MNGSDEDIRERLKVIAPASYWRNVFQFAVGKCFVEREHLLDNLVALCSALNEETACKEIMLDKTAAQASKAVLWGSRLALDILSDGTARQFPGKEYLFARIALQLVKLPEAEIGARLASVFHEELTDLYIEVITDRLARTNLWERIGAFQLLTSLSDLEVSWAIRMLNAEWPNDATLQITLLTERLDRNLPKWASTKLVEVLPRINPLRIRPLLSMSLIRSYDALGGWKQVAEFVLNRGANAAQALNRSSWHDLVPAFAFSRINVASELAQFVSDKHFQDNHWLPFVAAFRFGANPTCHSLAAELRGLAETYTSMQTFDVTSIPWPLALCLRFAKDKETFLKVADAADKGVMGDTKDWHSAEQRWLDQGVNDDDVNQVISSQLPFDSRIASVGFPFSVTLPSFAPGPWVNQLAQYISKLKLITDPDARRYFSAVVVDSFLEQYEDDLSIDQFRELYCLWDEEKLEDFRLDPFLKSIQNEEAQNWIDVLDQVGRSRFWISSRFARCDVADELIHYLTVQPTERKGLLRIIAEIAKNGCAPQVPKHILETALTWEPPFRQDAICLILARSDVKRSEMLTFATEITSSNFPFWQVWRSLRISSHASLSRAAEFAVLLLKQLPENSKQLVDAGDYARRVLNEFLTNRPSVIQDESVWKRLNLPEKV